MEPSSDGHEGLTSSQPNLDRLPFFSTQPHTWHQASVVAPSAGHSDRLVATTGGPRRVMRIELEHGFDVPLRYGFDYITDPGNWAEFWPGFIRLETGWRWSEPGDRARLVVRLLGRSVKLDMTLNRLVPYSLVEYTSVQSGLPDAHHERHFEAAGIGFCYRLVVNLAQGTGAPRRLFDRALVRPAAARAMRRTVHNLDRRFRIGPSGLGDDEGV